MIEIASPKGFFTGTGVIRDKDGNIKGEFTLSGEATPEQVEQVFGKESLNGRNSDDDRA